MCPASVTGIVTGDVAVSYWPLFVVLSYKHSQKSWRKFSRPVSVVKWRICIYFMFATLPKPAPPTPPSLFLLLGTDTLFSSLKKNLPALCSVAAECVSAFSAEFWLQTQLLQVT